MGTVSPRENLPLAALARMTAEELLNTHPRGRPMLADELAGALELALLAAVRAERRACVAECTRRADLWERAAELAETSEVMRVEARHRANEAHYLADAIATRT